MTMHIEKKYLILVSLVLLFAFGIGIRAFGLASWPITGDEYFSVRDALNLWSNAGDRWISSLRNLGYLLIVFSFETFGVSEWSARLPSFLLGAATIPIFFRVSVRHRGLAIAVVATILLIFHPWHIFQSQFSRFYTGMVLFGFLSSYYFFESLREDDLRKYILSIVSLGVAVLFQKLAIVIFGCFTIFSILSLLNILSRATTSRRLNLITAGLAVIGGGSFAPYGWRMLTGWYHSGQSWGAGPVHLMLQIVDHFGLLICCAAFFGLILTFRRDRIFACWQLILIGLPVLLLIAGSFFVPVRADYIIYLLPFVLLLAAQFAVQVVTDEENNGIVRVAIPLLLILSILPQSVSYFTSKLTFDGRDAIAYIQTHRMATDKIISWENTFKYYAPASWELERYQGEPFSGVVDWNAKLSSYAVSKNRVWIILPKRRVSWDPSLVDWLTCYARPVKEYIGKSYEYADYGTSIYLKDNSGPYCRSVPEQN